MLGGLTALAQPWIPTTDGGLRFYLVLFLYSPAGVLAILSESLEIFPVLCILQFPVYGYVLGLAQKHRKLEIAVVCFLVTHVLAIAEITNRSFLS